MCLSEGSPDESDEEEVVRAGERPNLWGMGWVLSGESDTCLVDIRCGIWNSEIYQMFVYNIDSRGGALEN